MLFGKPSGMMERFDLVVAGAEVQLPPRPNVVPIRLPLMRARASRSKRRRESGGRVSLRCPVLWSRS